MYAPAVPMAAAPTVPPLAPMVQPMAADAPPPLPAPEAPLPRVGVVIAGRAVITDFAPLASPGDVAEVCLFLLPDDPAAGAAVPDGHGAVLHYTADGAHWQALGAVTRAKPSGVFRTGWGMQRAMRASAAIQLGAALEPLAAVENLQLADGAGAERRALARKIAGDLYKFAASFASSAGGGGGDGGATLAVPANFLERWIEKFDARSRVDPGFMMKND